MHVFVYTLYIRLIFSCIFHICAEIFLGEVASIFARGCVSPLKDYFGCLSLNDKERQLEDIDKKIKKVEERKLHYETFIESLKDEGATADKRLDHTTPTHRHWRCV